MRCVLIVEDEAPVRIALSEFLRTTGFHVLEAQSAAEAVRLLDRLSRRVDVVFSDIRMPGAADGFALAKWVRDTTRHIPVLLTSGDIATAKRAYKLAPGDKFLAKPYDFDEAALMLEEIIVKSFH